MLRQVSTTGLIATGIQDKKTGLCPVFLCLRCGGGSGTTGGAVSCASRGPAISTPRNARASCTWTRGSAPNGARLHANDGGQRADALVVPVELRPTVDGAAVEDAWPLAVRAGGPDRMVCLLLLGHGLAPARELAAKIAEQRRRTRQVAPVVVPVDTRDWTALLPPETPSAVRKLLDRLKLGG